MQANICPNMRFRYLDHTADAMIESYGKTLEEAFVNACLAMFNLLTDIDKVKAVKKHTISISSNKHEKLLFDFFDELLFYLDTEHIIFCKFENVSITQKNEKFILKCNAFGDTASNYERHGDVKAPTYNEMKIEKTRTGYKIRAVVDI